MGKILSLKVKERGRRDSVEYKNKINLYDPTQISLVLDDLINLFDAPIRKACVRVLNKNNKLSPFS